MSYMGHVLIIIIIHIFASPATSAKQWYHCLGFFPQLVHPNSVKKHGCEEYSMKTGETNKRGSGNTAAMWIQYQLFH